MVKILKPPPSVGGTPVSVDFFHNDSFNEEYFKNGAFVFHGNSAEILHLLEVDQSRVFLKIFVSRDEGDKRKPEKGDEGGFNSGMQLSSAASSTNCSKHNEHSSQPDIQPVIAVAAHSHSIQATMAEAAMRPAIDSKSGPVGAHVVTSAAQPFQILGCNEAFLRLTGHQSIGSSLKILYGKTTRINALESTISAAEDGGVHECQLRLYTANAQPLLVRVAVSLVNAKEGEMSRHLCAEVAKVMLLVLSPVKSIRR